MLFGQSEVHFGQWEHRHLLVTSGCWAWDLLREEIFKWKCNSMLWILILLSSSFSQGPFSRCYNLPPQPLSWESSDSILTEEKLHLPCSRTKQCPWVVIVLLQMLIISVVLLGFSQHLLAVLLPRDAAPDPENLGGCHCHWGGTGNKPVEEAGSRSHFCPQEKVWDWGCAHMSISLAVTQLMQSSPHFTLSSSGISVVLHMSHIKGLTCWKLN